MIFITVNIEALSRAPFEVVFNLTSLIDSKSSFSSSDDTWS